MKRTILSIYLVCLALISFGQTFQPSPADDTAWVADNGDSIFINYKLEPRTGGFTYYVAVPQLTVKKKEQQSTPPVTVPGTYPGYELMYETGFDKQADIVNGSNQLAQGSISTTIKKDGAGSFRSLVNSNSASNISSGWRSEVQYSSNYSKDREDIIVEYETYYEKLYSNNGLNGQWHGNAEGTSGQLSLWVQNGKFVVMRNVADERDNIYQTGTLKAIKTGKWYKIRWEIRFSPGNDGYVRLYIDDMTKPYYSASGRTSDGTGQYFKIGTNRWNVNSESIVYFDNLKIYKKQKSTGSHFTTNDPYGFIQAARHARHFTNAVLKESLDTISIF